MKGAGRALGTSLRGDAAEDSGCIVCADSACLTDLDDTISDMRHYTGFYSLQCLKNGLVFGFPA